MLEQVLDLPARHFDVPVRLSVDESTHLVVGLEGRADDLVVVAVPAAVVDLLRLEQPPVGHQQVETVATHALVLGDPAPPRADAGERFFPFGESVIGLESGSETEREGEHREE